MAEYDLVKGYGVKLHRLTRDRIELLRYWRNHPKIQQYMEFRQEIDREQQIKWFNKIDNENNYYFIIEIDGKEIGCINIRDIDYQEGEGEPGIFIWDDDYLNGSASYKAGLCLYDFIYENLGLTKTVIHILSDNPRSAKYFARFGYRIAENQDGIYNQEYHQSREDYLKIKESLISKHLK